MKFVVNPFRGDSDVVIAEMQGHLKAATTNNMQGLMSRPIRG